MLRVLQPVVLEVAFWMLISSLERFVFCGFWVEGEEMGWKVKIFFCFQILEEEVFWRCKVSEDDGDWMICGRFDCFLMLIFWTLP